MRELLPKRRASYVIEFDHEHQKYTATVGYYRDGRVAEIFLDCSKSGMFLQTAAHDAAVLASLAFQHGCSVETIQHALARNSDGSPAGPIGVLLGALPNEP
jgi:hypothetical protein